MKKFKNTLSVTGSKSLLKAFSEELMSIGYLGHMTSKDINWIDNPSHIFTNYDGGKNIYGFHNHSGGMENKITLSLPQDWDKAISLASEVEEEEVFKVGDIALVQGMVGNNYTGNGLIGEEIYRLLEIDRSKGPTGNIAEKSHFMVQSGEYFYMTEKKYVKRLATPEEKEKFLIEEKEKEGWVRGAKVGVTATGKIETIGNVVYNPELKEVCVLYDRACSYRSEYGVRILALKLLPSCPEITINGYTAKFEDWGLNFNCGCAKIAKEQFMHLDNLFNEKYLNNNKVITSVKIGAGEFTVKQITEIAEYYRNQKS